MRKLLYILNIFCLIMICCSLVVAQNGPLAVKTQQVLDSVPVAYADAGSSDETIIFIHGLGGNHKHWQANLPALSESFRTIAVDLPGYGASRLREVPGDSLLHFFSQVLAAFMDSLSIQQAHISGHSMGGQLAMLFCLQHPERVKSLILAAPAGLETFIAAEAAGLKQYAETTYPQPQSEEQLRAGYTLNFSRMPEAAEELIQERLRLNSASYYPIYAKVLIGGVHGMLDTPVAGRLHEIQPPTLIIFGEDDKLIPNRYLHPGLTTEEVGRKGAEAIPGSRLELIPGAGHLLMLEQPEAFNELVIDFLKHIHANNPSH